MDKSFITILGDNFRLYCCFVWAGTRSQMQYRASFLMLSISQFIAVAAEFVGLVAMFHRFGTLRGWSLEEVAVLYGIVHVSFAIAEGFGRGFDGFSTLVKSGDFDCLLVRPRPTALQVAGRELHFFRMGRLTLALAVLLWGINSIGVHWKLAEFILVFGSIVCGACIFYGIFVIQATLAFWTVDSLEIMNTVTYGGTEVAQYPISIYRPWFRFFFTFVVPLAFVNFIPAGVLLGRSDSTGFPSWMQWSAPAVGVIFLLLSLQIWRLGEKHYRSTGS